MIANEDLYGARVEYRQGHGLFREIVGFPRRTHISWTAFQVMENNWEDQAKINAIINAAKGGIDVLTSPVV